MTIVYDGDGNRVSETVGGVTTNYLVDTENPTGYAQVMEELQGGAVVRSYTWGHWLISKLETGNSKLSYYGYDGHGSVRFLTDTNGAVTDTYDYDAFGNLIGSTGSTPNNYLFAGEQFDSALGLYYNRARYLDVRTGRFWGMDGLNGQIEDPFTLHRYLYLKVDPIDHRDPSGNESIGELVEAASIYVQNVWSNARTAFAAGGAAVGTFFYGIGLYAQNVARQVIQTFTTINNEVVYEEIEEDVTVVVQNSRRVIDFYVRAKDGVSNLLIEVKYGLPSAGPALSRLVGQVNNALASGRASQVVVWTLRSPGLRQIQAVYNALGNAATEVQFVDGVEGLYDFLRFYYGGL